MNVRSFHAIMRRKIDIKKSIAEERILRSSMNAALSSSKTRIARAKSIAPVSPMRTPFSVMAPSFPHHN